MNTTPTDRALALAFVEVTDGGTNWNLYTGFDLVEAIERRAAEIDASKPNEPQGHQPPPDNIGPYPAPAEAVEETEQFPGFENWWNKHGQFCRAGGGDYEKTFAYRAWEAALAARPAAVGAEEVAIVCDWSDADPFPRFIEAEINGKSVSLEWRDREDGKKELVVPVALAARPAAVGGELPEGATAMEVVKDFLHAGRTMKPVGRWPGERVYAAIEQVLKSPSPEACEVKEYEWFDAKAGEWKPVTRLPYTWERELGIPWREVTLATQPQQLAVTDEAVLIACGIYAGENGEVSNYAMRRALTAALPHVVRKGE